MSNKTKYFLLFCLITLLSWTPFSRANNPAIEILLPGDIIVKEGSVTSRIDYLKVNRPIDKITLILTGEGVRFEDEKRRKVVKVNKEGLVTLPKIVGKKPLKENMLIIRTRERIFKSVRVYTNSKSNHEKVAKSLPLLGNAISIFTENYYIINFDKVSLSNELATIFNPKSRSLGEEFIKDRGTETIDFEPVNGKISNSLNTKGSCITRPYIPKTSWGSGKMTWANNPAQAGFSFKGEHNSSPWVRDLQCPAGPYKTDEYVDGIYRRSWQHIAYKIPDHCSVSREFIDGRPAFRCCCNTVMMSFGYGRCNFIDASEPALIDWPDGAKSTCYRRKNRRRRRRRRN